jgi:hypothetical protein
MRVGNGVGESFVVGVVGLMVLEAHLTTMHDAHLMH